MCRIIKSSFASFKIYKDDIPSLEKETMLSAENMSPFKKRLSISKLSRGDDQLACLPDAVLLKIFDWVRQHSKADLCHVSLLNKRYHILADAVLYNTVQFLTPEMHLMFSQSLRRNPRRGSAIHEIKLAYPASGLSTMLSEQPHRNGHGNGFIKDDHSWSWPIDNLSQTISTMSNLEILDIAVPENLLNGIGQLFNGPFDLASLRTCTLFYQGSGDGYWDLQENIHIFAQPALEKLVIKRAKLDHRGFDLLESPHETALTTLHLIECDINDDALSDLLMFPKGLKEFVMTQNATPTPELEESSSSIRDYIIALNSASHSLETLIIDFPMLQSSRALALREFSALKTLRLNWDYQLFGKSTKKPRLTSVGIPPELETLEFFNELGTDEEVTDLFISAVETLQLTARKLSRIIVIEEENGNPVPKELEQAIRLQKQIQLDVIGRLESANGN